VVRDAQVKRPADDDGLTELAIALEALVAESSQATAYRRALLLRRPDHQHRAVGAAQQAIRSRAEEPGLDAPETA
jgi:hypothetical protein